MNMPSNDRANEVPLMLGRMLMDQGFRDLFRHDPLRAGAALGLSLQPATVAHLQRSLAKLEAMDVAARSRFSTHLSSLERWKQA
jgi:hypothetical protein